MTERIDNIVYHKPDKPSTIEGNETTLFLTGPAEFLCESVAKALLALPVWVKIFGEYIDSYKRMDYPMRALPALRIYNKVYGKQTESWFIEGDLICDLIFPANIRRKETEQLPDSITAAMLQQFRSPTFFSGLCDITPGLNELGKRFDVDKDLAFEWGEDLVPLTQMSVNFRIDLRQWDLYLESDNRTKETPFVRTLGDLNRIAAQIQGLRDDGEVEVTVETDQKV